MKKIVRLKSKANIGLEKLLGEKVTLFCMNYFYTGRLIGVNKLCVLLEDPAIVYETGAWTTKDYSDVQKLPSKELYVMINSIESFGVLK